MPLEGWAGWGKDHGFYSLGSGKEGQTWESLEGWGLLATVPHFCPTAEAAIGVITVFLSGAGEKPLLGPLLSSSV